MPIKTVAVVGTGVIGASWAAFYAGKGFAVRLFDADPASCQRGYDLARGYIETLAAKGLLSDPAQAVDRIRCENDLKSTLSQVQLVQESVAENYSVKQTLYRQMDRLTAPEAILASSSSGLLMTRIQKAADHPGRCLIAHPFNPPHLVPLVELVPGEKTRPETIAAMKAFFENLGKIPVVLQKEAPGHIANRLAAALWREAVDIVLKGIASVEDVDKALFAGPGVRWALMGQHMIYHLGGGEAGLSHFIDHLGPAFEKWWQDMATWTTLPEEAKASLTCGIEKASQGKSIDDLARWRDDKLIDVLKVIYDDPKQR